MRLAQSLNQLFDWAEELSKESLTSLIWTGDPSGSIENPIYLFSKPKKSVLLYENRLVIDDQIIPIKKEHWWQALVQATQDGEIWSGYLSYDLTASLFDLNLPSKNSTSLPLAALFNPSFSAMYQGSTPLKPSKDTKYHCNPSLIDFSHYEEAFSKIKELILDGDIYQINLTHEIEFNLAVDSFNLFKSLFTQAPPPFGFYLGHPEFALASISPELFVRSKNGIVETRPMKGTRSLIEGLEASTLALNNSEKEQAELSMITDLMRNDLCMICTPTTIQLDAPFVTKPYGSLLQRFSIITGQLSNPNDHPLNTLKHIFPGGSITGCPKERACKRIYELEQRQRGPYTGAAGFWTHDRWHWNMTIRTAIIDKNLSKVVYPVGGGIVINSELKSEWNETQLKADSILKIFGS